MREIKFRAFNIRNKEWDNFTLDELARGDLENLYGWGIYEKWCEYTGLKDKNGKEIYEGDIVSECDFYLGDSFIRASKGEIVFGNGSFYCKSAVETFGDLNPEAIQNYQVEVVGNTYENPGILK
jgi:hypothetical protein